MVLKYWGCKYGSFTCIYFTKNSTVFKVLQHFHMMSDYALCPFEYSSDIITGQEVIQISNSKSYNVVELTFVYALWNLSPLKWKLTN